MPVWITFLYFVMRNENQLKLQLLENINEAVCQMARIDLNMLIELIFSLLLSKTNWSLKAANEKNPNIC